MGQSVSVPECLSTRSLWRGRKGGPKTAKPHRNTPKKTQTTSDFFLNTENARTWRPQYESWRQQDLWYIQITFYVNIKHPIITLTVYCQVCGSCTWTSTDISFDFEKLCHWSCTSCIVWLITLDDHVLVVKRGTNVSSGIENFLSRKVFTLFYWRRWLLKRAALPYRVLAPIKNVTELPISPWSNVKSSTS